ncbi:MAG: ethanolamine utilization protein EutJ [Thermodesulfobacteriota bacterium]
MSAALAKVRRLVNRPQAWDLAGSGRLFAGVDLGTYKAGVIVVDENGEPRAALVRRAEVVRSGLVLDYAGALALVRRMMDEINSHAPRPVVQGATSYPPRTEAGNVSATRHILETVGLEVVNVLDEPTAASLALGLRDGAVVDVGGGTTGVAVIEDGRVVHSDDEATGGVHLTLVLAGGLKVGYEEAELIKTDPRRQKEILPMVRPVLDKISVIVGRCLADHPEVRRLVLVGGTCEFEGLAEVVAQNLGLEAMRPTAPQMVTPLGIALSCLVRDDREQLTWGGLAAR